jgi:hypothetical protein
MVRMNNLRGVVVGWLAAAVFGCLAVSGCGRAPADVPTVPIHPISGTVTVDGKPIAGAFVVLHALQGATVGDVTPNGVTDENGKFELSTYSPKDGAPEGSYTATVSWPERLPGGGSEPEYGRERLPVRYQNPSNSGLVVAVSADLRDPVVLELKSK